MAIKYNRKFFEILKDLSALNNAIVFHRDSNGGNVRRKSVSNVIYHLTYPNEVFDHNLENFGIYNYAEFYQFFKLFGNPEIDINSSNIILKENSTNATYFIQNTEACYLSNGEDPQIGNWQNADVKFQITSKDIESLVKASSLISSTEKYKKIRIHGNSSEVNVELVNQNINVQNNVYDKTYNRVFNVDSISGQEVSYDFMINAEFFTNIPRKDYMVEIKAKGSIKAYFVEDDISVNIYTSYVQSV